MGDPDNGAILGGLLTQGRRELKVFNDGKLMDKNNNTIDSLSKEIEKKKEETQEEILGESCKSISFQGISQVGEQIATATYFYSGEPFVDSQLYVEWKDFFTNEFFSASSSPYLKYILKAKYFDLIITASKIEERDLSAEIFKLPQGILVKEKKPW